MFCSNVYYFFPFRMNPSKESVSVTRGPGFAVQDLIAAIQNFDVQQGSVSEAQASSEPGLSGDVVMNSKSERGVDLLDSFVAKYKFPMKSHRWFIYIFWHTIALTVINAWLLYKQECKAINMPKREILNRRKFPAQLASALILLRVHFYYSLFIKF